MRIFTRFRLDIVPWLPVEPPQCSGYLTHGRGIWKWIRGLEMPFIGSGGCITGSGQMGIIIFQERGQRIAATGNASYCITRADSNSRGIIDEYMERGFTRCAAPC